MGIQVFLLYFFSGGLTESDPIGVSTLDLSDRPFKNLIWTTRSMSFKITKFFPRQNLTIYRAYTIEHILQSQDYYVAIY